MNKTRIGLKIQTLRKAGGYSQRSLSEASGVAYATLQEIEKGRGNPTVDTLEALSKTLGIPVVELFELESGGTAPAEFLGSKGFAEGHKQLTKAKRNRVASQIQGSKIASKTVKYGKSVNAVDFPDFSSAVSFLEKVQELSDFRKALLLAIAYRDEQYLQGEPALVQAYRALFPARDK